MIFFQSILFIILSIFFTALRVDSFHEVNPLKRYGLPEISKIWTDENRFQIFFEIEGYINEALAKSGIVSDKLPERYWKNGKFSVEKIREYEKTTQHEFLAFLAAVGDSLGEDAKSIHYGVTSSNVLDTGLNVQLTQSIDLINKELDFLLNELKKISIKYKYMLSIGRTHGMHAEPLSFGLKILRFYSEFKRHKEWLALARKDIAICSIGGAVGNFANIEPDIEAYVANKLNFAVEPIASQIIPRDRYARLFSIISVMASSIESLANEIRHLQRSEVGEVQESFASGQKGSSAMPHKRNPIKSENLVGIARLIRSNSIAAMENVALWHERDMSHSSVERFIAPQGMILLHYALNTIGKIISGIIVNEKAVADNLALYGNVFFSQKLLLALVQKGIDRDDGYKIVQKLAHYALDKDECFVKVSSESKEIKNILTKKELDEIFDLNAYLKNTDYLYKRVFVTDYVE